MTFSLIIINYRTTKITAQCLRSIFLFCPEPNREIILIDNASGDQGIEELVEEFGDRIKIIKNTVNRGFAGANNQGAEIARGEYFFFLNSDTILEADILTPLHKVLQEHPEIGVLSPRLVNPDGSHQTKAFGSFPTLARLIGKNRLTEKESVLEDGLNFFDWVSGAALIVRKNVFDKIGGWDENFFLYLEDTDFCWRAKEAGGQVAVYSPVSLIHLGGQSLKTGRAKRSHYFRSQDYFFHKHYGWLRTGLMKIIRWPYKFIILHKKHENRP